MVDRDIPETGAGQVRVKVEACGICHSDVFVKDGVWPGLQYQRVPGHEIAGRIDALGNRGRNNGGLNRIVGVGETGPNRRQPRALKPVPICWRRDSAGV